MGSPTSYLEDHPRTCKWLGSPLFTSHETRPFIKGPITPFRGQQRSPWLAAKNAIFNILVHYAGFQSINFDVFEVLPKKQQNF